MLIASIFSFNCVQRALIGLLVKKKWEDTEDADTVKEWICPEYVKGTWPYTEFTDQKF